MNPPFHLRKGENSLMIKDTYDVDFIKRAYSMLKEGGKLCAIIGGSFKSAKEGDPLFWINANKKNKDMKITIYKLNKKKYSGVMVANTFIVIIDKLKIIPKEDDDILAIKFYDDKRLESIGADVESGKLNIKDIPKQLEAIIPKPLEAIIPKPLEALTPTESLKKTLKGLSRKRR
jgi:hypothetical protein